MQINSERHNIAELEERAKQGDADSLFNLGLLYYGGIGVTSDGAKGLEYFKQAAAQGSSAAHTMLGLEYARQATSDMDFIKAAYHYELGASGGNAESQLLLADLFLKGKGVKQDIKQAVHYFEMAAAQGFPRALHTLAIFYLEGVYYDKDMAKAQVFTFIVSALGLGEDMLEALNKELAENITSSEKEQAQKIATLFLDALNKKDFKQTADIIAGNITYQNDSDDNEDTEVNLLGPMSEDGEFFESVEIMVYGKIKSETNEDALEELSLIRLDDKIIVDASEWTYKGKSLTDGVMFAEFINRHDAKLSIHVDSSKLLKSYG